MKAYIVRGETELVNFMPELEITDSLKEADIVIFGDGPIVSPSLYKEKKLSDLDMKCDINRDRADKAIYTKMKSGQIAVGIGRGACFLSVMNGASLIQYTYKPRDPNSYPIRFRLNGNYYEVPVISDWIQSINYMDCTDFDLIAVSKQSSDYIIDNNELKRFMKHNGDAEVIKFHKPNKPVSICIQFHPEWMPKAFSSEFVKQIIYGCHNS